MALVKHHKVVAALPPTLEADSIYYVRAGAGFDIYVTNGAGAIAAYPLNASGAAQGFFRTEPITATSSGQTSFTVPGGYTPGAIFVSLNGASLPPADFTATNGTTVVLASGDGIVAGSVLLVHVLSAFEVADALPVGGTAADSSKLGGQAPSHYATQADLEGVTPGPEFYQRNNILGTVSQSGGVPTGAIIERGSNANGDYVRFADGTQICWKLVTTDAAGFSTMSLPVGFVGEYGVSHAVTSSSSSLLGIKVGSRLASSISLAGVNSANSFLTIAALITLIGRWF